MRVRMLRPDLQDIWDSYSPDEQRALRAPATPLEYEPFLGWRVEVTTLDGGRVRGIVGRSTGWRPCYLLLARRNCIGGYPAPAAASIRPLYKVR